MFYRLFRYHLDNERGPISENSHYKAFRDSRAKDENGRLAIYRNKEDSILMHVRGGERRFCGRVGRQATQREITRYRESDDVADDVVVADSNIPNVSFLCVPEISMIACEDGVDISAESALRRLHVILSHRRRLVFIFSEIDTQTDLRQAAAQFSLIKVSFEVMPVNPHSGDLGLKLDANNKLDNIGRMRGEVVARNKNKPLKLEGGTLEAIEQLRASGHAAVGFNAVTKQGTEISVKKTSDDDVGSSKKSADDEDLDQSIGGKSAVRISFKDRPQYPYRQDHMDELEGIMRSFRKFKS